MVPTYTTIELQPVFLFIVDVDTDHLRGIQTLTLLAPAASPTSTREAHIVDIVGSCEEHHLQVVFHHSSHAPACITLLSTDSEVDIGHDTMIHAFLDAKVEHGLFLTILNARDTGQITLLVIGTDALNDIRGQVLQSCLRITRHELLTVDEDLLHLLAIDLDGSIIAHLSTREALHEFLNDGSLGGAIRTGIIYKGVGLEGHLRGMGSDGGTFQHNRIRLERDSASTVILTVLEGDRLRVGLETHIRNLQGVTALTGGLDGECARGVGHGIGYYLLTCEQSRRSLDHGFVGILFNYLSCYCPLCKGRQ